jgi:hypothetical protein
MVSQPCLTFLPDGSRWIRVGAGRSVCRWPCDGGNSQRSSQSSFNAVRRESGIPGSQLRPVSDVSLQTPICDGISDGILTIVKRLHDAEQTVPARLNIIARYVERMLSASQDGDKSPK